MSKLLRRQLLALMLGVTGLTLAMPLTHNAAAFAEDGGSDNGAGSGHHSASGGDGGQDDDGGSDDAGIAGDDDAGPVGGASKATFQEGCAITDLTCLNQPVK